MRCCWQGPCSELASAEYYMCLLRDVCHTCLSASMSVFLSVGRQVWKKSRSAVPGQQKWPRHSNPHRQVATGYMLTYTCVAHLPACLPACLPVHLSVHLCSCSCGLQARGGTCRHGGVMVSTDAAARGIDIPNVTHVIQADFAASAVDFIHRVRVHLQFLSAAFA